MKRPKLPSGTTGFFNDKNEWVATGSQMGRRDSLPVDRSVHISLRIAQLKWVDGDYDEAGAYWGQGSRGEHIYHVWGTCDAEDMQVEMFVRATSKDNARKAVKAALPNAMVI